jgi:xanthosine phosphorylase
MSLTPATPHHAADAIRPLLKGLAPKIAIVLGSGLGGVADTIADARTIPYAEIPGFPVSKVQGHSSRLIAGKIAGVDAIVLQGRAHVYEGADAAQIKIPIRALKTLGVDRLWLTNAAGSFHPANDEGSLVLIEDHISWAGWSPLQGPNEDEWGPRFVALTDAYDPEFRAVLKTHAAKLGFALPEGVYAWYLGPNFETPAEIRALRGLGGDVVGMSTVPEVIVARHCGLRVATISAITNLAAGMRINQHLSHDHTQRIAKLCAEKLDRLIPAALPDLVRA